MIFSRWKIWLFLAFSIGGIAVLVAMPGRIGAGTEINPRTGENILGIDDLVNLAKAYDNAALAHSKLKSVLRDAPEERRVLEAVTLLSRELSRLTPPSSDDPALQRLSSEDVDLYSLTELLEQLLGDVDYAVATERFFSSTPLRRPTDATNHRPDGDARQALKLLRTRGSKPRIYLEAARSFTEAGRLRASIRWLIRGYRAHPESTEIRNRLMKVYVELSRLVEAFAVSTHAIRYAPEDLEFWQRRAAVAGWLSVPSFEAAALQRAFDLEGDPGVAKRLLDLYVHLGHPERAVPFAVYLAEGAGELAEYEKAARLALTSGLPERALELLNKVVEGAENPTPWREMIVDCALQDLRVDVAIAELEKLDVDHPATGYERRLEELYRRVDLPEKLADLLERRLDRNPKLSGVWKEALTLRAAIGDSERTDALLTKLASVDLGPLQFFQNLSTFRRAGVPLIETRGLEFAQSPQLDHTVVGEVLATLRPFLREPRFRRIAESLLMRFEDDEASIAFRVDLVDSYDTSEEQAKAAESLAEKFPADTDLLRVWAERAGWASLHRNEIRARQALAELQNDNIDNYVRLAELHGFVGEHEAAVGHWRRVVAVRGVRDESTDQFVAALLAANRLDEALEWMEKRASHPDATLEDKVSAAETLFSNNHVDLSAVYYRAVVEFDPDHPLALLRLGQIHSWSNDPRGAIPYLERRLATSEDDRHFVDYYLGEALWSIREDSRATFHHERSLPAMRDADQTIAVRSMIGRILFRLGDGEKAEQVYRELVALEPANLDLALDLVEVLVYRHNIAEARAVVDRAREIDGRDARYLRVDGQLYLHEGDLAKAKAAFLTCLDLHGPNAGVHADLGRTFELDAEWRQALDHYGRWFSLQSRSTEAARAVRRATDHLANIALVQTRYRSVGDDRSIESETGLSLPLASEHTRLSFRLGHGLYRGRAQAIANGTRSAEENVSMLDGAVNRDLGDGWQIGGGVGLYPGAPGSVPAGAWVGLHVEDQKPFSVLEARAFVNELLTDPFAAPALEGRKHGVEAQLFRELGDRWWLGASAQLRALQVSPPGGSSATDAQLMGELSIGYNAIEGLAAIGTPFDVKRLPSGPISPALVDTLDRPEPMLLSTWLTFNSSYLLDDGELANLLPIGKRFNYLIGSVRADQQLAAGLGGSIQARIGREFSSSSNIWAATAGLTWRPNDDCEFALSGEIGDALGRAGDSGSHGVSARFVLRW